MYFTHFQSLSPFISSHTYSTWTFGRHIQTSPSFLDNKTVDLGFNLYDSRFARSYFPLTLITLNRYNSDRASNPPKSDLKSPDQSKFSELAGPNPRHQQLSLFKNMKINEDESTDEALRKELVSLPLFFLNFAPEHRPDLGQTRAQPPCESPKRQWAE